MNGRTHGAWDRFAKALAEVLGELAVGEILRMEVWWTTPTGERELLTHAYALRHARHRMRVAVAAGDVVPKGRGHRLSLRQDARLNATGWRPPSPWAGPDYYFDGHFEARDVLADRLIAALKDVWELPGPEVLTIIGRPITCPATGDEGKADRLGA